MPVKNQKLFSKCQNFLQSRNGRRRAIPRYGNSRCLCSPVHRFLLTAPLEQRPQEIAGKGIPGRRRVHGLDVVFLLAYAVFLMEEYRTMFPKGQHYGGRGGAAAPVNF